MKSKTNIVLVHGAWADGSSWSKVIPLLQQSGFNVTAAQIPLTSLADDIVATRNLLAAQKGPAVLAVLLAYAGIARLHQTSRAECDRHPSCCRAGA
jgi:pimeloyl-ACP methyl ester carboxylesterase